MRGWGIYATTIGALLAYPSYTRWILIVCFICSIVWHMHIASRTTSLPAGWTAHHTHAVGLNGFAILLVLLH